MSKHTEALPLLKDRLSYFERSIARAEQQINLRRNQMGDPATPNFDKAAARFLTQAEADLDKAQAGYDDLAATIKMLEADQ